MKPYPTLTFAGKLRRLRQLALQTLERYPLKIARFSMLSFSTNLIYAVDTEAGERFVLRLASPGWRTFENLQAEALWLEALARDTDIRLPEVVRTRDGEAVAAASSEAVTGTRYMTLMRRLPGRLMVGSALSDANLEKMGALFARLHAHAAAWQPPAGFNPQRFEHVISRGEPFILFAPEQVEAFPAKVLPKMQALYERVESAYAGLDRSDLRVIHCDLWHENIKLYRGELCPFDFEDTIWGFRLHDIAMAMLDLHETVENEYPRLLSAFQRGYTASLPWPDGDLTLLQLGRIFWVMNWIARFDREHLGGALEHYAALFERYEQTGRLVPPIRF